MPCSPIRTLTTSLTLNALLRRAKAHLNAAAAAADDDDNESKLYFPKVASAAEMALASCELKENENRSLRQQNNEKKVRVDIPHRYQALEQWHRPPILHSPPSSVHPAYHHLRWKEGWRPDPKIPRLQVWTKIRMEISSLSPKILRRRRSCVRRNRPVYIHQARTVQLAMVFVISVKYPLALTGECETSCSSSAIVHTSSRKGPE